MAGERLVLRGLVAVGEAIAPKAKLADEALELMGSHGRVVSAEAGFIDEVAMEVLAALKKGEPRQTMSLMFDYLTHPTSKSAMASIEQLPVSGMKPEAFKVLTAEGYSPNFGKSLQWSLPRFEHGKWTPGQWMDVSDKPFGMDGLYISNNADRWLKYYGKPGRDPVTAFRVQIGDPVGRALWEKPLPGMDMSNFKAKTIRLIEPI